ncbi:hypothetical protein BU14_1056s0001 [Porphyra umbilicalis]|uniref:Coatomer subunit beta n=1 Tax=Porphyra umbilicalis TaxID=2786 RepID=A0A1X6NML1_PORUM|nr:hypothetical protein BU14_1056s0001 [Porphyra umbilicalis]|eukprot:OSX69861.1 hypothetical protein BU14_1056s0001 [Porphyra umbilicalis]
MSSALERQCSLLINSNAGSGEVAELRTGLESSDVEAKLTALKRVIHLQLTGEPLPGMLMTVIRYVLPHENTHLRKMGLYFLEIVDARGDDGAMRPEMILVCNMVRNELVHANEFSRGCSLRFVCKLNDMELLEPLVPAVRQNLEHRHSFVRRNAVLAVSAIFTKFEALIPDAPELVAEFLAAETDVACQRNAFAMLCAADVDRAVAYLHEHLSAIAGWGDTLQLAALELIRRVCRMAPLEKGKYIQVIFALLSSSSAAVVYEAANTLISMSGAPTAVRAAAQAYCSLLASQSDNNVKLILLDRVSDLQTAHTPVLTEMVMDILRALSSPNADIRRKTLSLAMSLLTRRNVDEVVGVLKKELLRHAASSGPTALAASSELRGLLLRALHTAAVRFPDAAPAAVSIIGDFLSDEHGEVAVDAAAFAREIAHTREDLRPEILRSILDALLSLGNATVVRGALWILGEYAESPADLKASFQTVLQAVGRLPLAVADDDTDPETADGEADAGDTGVAEAEKPKKVSRRPTVLADGTYASQTMESETASAAASKAVAARGASGGAGGKGQPGPPLRMLLVNGEYFVAAAVCAALTKLALRLSAFEAAPATLRNKVRAEAMLVCASILRYGRDASALAPIDNGAAERITACILSLTGTVTGDTAETGDTEELWLDAPRAAYDAVVREKRRKEAAAAKAEALKEAVPAEEVIGFGLLRSGRRVAGTGVDEADLGEDADLSRARDGGGKGGKGGPGGFELGRVVQLTGMSDPVYAEAHVAVHEYDIMLDILVMNVSNETLTNLTVELATMGDLRLCERPQAHTLAAGARVNVRANIKVSSTETGIIFGNVVYDVAGAAAASGCVILNDVHMDVMDYMRPAEVHDAAFRSMWAEFEWENKVAVSTALTSLSALLNFIIESTNMRCLTLRGSEDEAGYLAANLYARSVFGEDALVNVSVDRGGDGRLAGFIRIRSKTQGIALSLGDKITLRQSQAQMAAASTGGGGGGGGRGASGQSASVLAAAAM